MSLAYLQDDVVQTPEIQFSESLKLNPKETAVIVVDMQNDFVKPSGSLLVERAAEVIPNIQRLLKAARQASVQIVYTQDTHYDNDPEWELWPRHCKIGEWGWQIIDELSPTDSDHICRKSRYDAFYGTELEHLLSHVWGIKNVVVVGTVSNICVLHTAASAGLRWFNVVMPAQAVAPLTDFDQVATLYQVTSLYAGQVVERVDQITFE